MIKYTPKINRTPALALVIFSLISSLVLVGFSFFVSGNLSSAIMKMLGMSLLLFATMIVTRYLSCTYIYILNEYDFIITKCTKTTNTTICRLSYTVLSDITEYSKVKRTVKEQNIGKLNYCSSLLCRDPYCLFYDTDDKRGVILLEADQSFANELKKRITPDIKL